MCARDCDRQAGFSVIQPQAVASSHAHASSKQMAAPKWKCNPDWLGHDQVERDRALAAHDGLREITVSIQSAIELNISAVTSPSLRRERAGT